MSLGESLVTVEKFDVPLAQATTSSLEALKVYSLGSTDAAAMLSNDLRAIHLDPSFAMGYLAVGRDYVGLGQRERAQDYLTKAFDLREHASELERLAITAEYYEQVTGELDNAARTYQEMIESYPRIFRGYVSLAWIYWDQGNYEKALEMIRKSLSIGPDLPWAYRGLGDNLMALQRFEEARQTFRQARTQDEDDYSLHNSLYGLAFLHADSPAVAEQQNWFASKPVYEHNGLSLASDTEAYSGHLVKARDLTQRSVDSAIRADNRENAAIWLENAAVREGAFGNLKEAEEVAASGMKLAPSSRNVEVETALALAMAGKATRAESLARELNMRFPLDTHVQSLWLSVIHAQLALNQRKAKRALNDLQAATTQKILDHSGIVWNCWTGALAHLGVARANALQSKTS